MPSNLSLCDHHCPSRAVARHHGQPAVVGGRGAAGRLRFFSLFTLVLLAVVVWAHPARAVTAFTNSARLSSGGSSIATATNTAWLDAPTDSVLRFYQYAPTAPGASLLQVPPTHGSDGSTAIGDVYPAGSTTPIDLTGPVPLVVTDGLHQNDPVFIEVADGDQDRNPTVAETVWVEVSVPGSVESELLLLTESGPNTGIFRGYIQSRGDGTPSANDGVLHVSADTQLVGEYLSATDPATARVLIDPYGIIFDSATGNPVNGATVRLVNASTGSPAAVFGDDATSTYPSSITSGGTATDSSGRIYSFPAGGFRFPFVAPGDYRIVVSGPAGYAAPSAVPTIELQALPGGPFAIREPGSRGEAFTINPGPSINMDIPVDPVSGGLWLRKSASKETVAIGDFVGYSLDLQNSSGSAASGVTIVDRLPLGFRYQSGSARLDDSPLADPQVSSNGRILTFSLNSLAGGSSTQVRYVVEVAAGARLGEAVNTATAAESGGNRSNRAKATVTVKEDLFRTENIIVGRVIAENCDDVQTDAADGVAGVRIYMEDGSFVVTDEQGMYHFEGVSRGTHVVQLDLDSLPDTVQMADCPLTSRHAGNAWSQFVDLQGGSLWRADFHVRRKADLPADTPLKGRDAKVECPTPPTDESTSYVKTLGILDPADGSRLVNPIHTIRVRLDSRLAPKLLLDNKLISDERIGFRLDDPTSQSTIYSYIGVDFGAAGSHRLELLGIGPFGNTRFKETLTVVRTGEVASLHLVESEGNVADGKTPVTLTLELRDRFGQVIAAPADLTITDGELKPCETDDDPISRRGKPTEEIVQVNADGRVQFAPVTASGRYRVTLVHNDATLEAEVSVQPFLRDWILVGLAEGSAGYNTVSGNMEELDADDGEEKFYEDGRVAFFAKGKLRGKWLLTLAYDSEKERRDPNNPLFQTIDPDTYYTLYGDRSEQQADAASIRKLYVKLEREDFALLFGDYETGLTVTELSRYSRSLNGLKSDYNGKIFSFSGFATGTAQAFVKDEIRGDGTSGLYRLTRKNLLLNSEKVTIETRDRYKSEVVLESRAMSRHVDYSIDYDDGTLFFKSPVPSRDDGFNPVYIVVEYETDEKTREDYTYGGRGAVKLLGGQVEAGATYVHEGPENADGDLGGVDLTIKLGAHTRFKAEVAATRREERGDTKRDNAWLAEIEHNSDKLDARLYAREQGEEFGLGQQNGSESGSRKIGLETDYRINDSLSAMADVHRQTNLTSDTRRDAGEGRLAWDGGDYRLYGGMRLAEDHRADGDVDRSNMLLAGAATTFYEDRLQLRLDHEQLVGGGDNASDYPTRTLAGVDLRLTEAITLFGEQEMTWGSDEDTQSTRAGITATPWSGGQVGTSVGRETAESGQRVFANLGLNQSWQLSERWTVDGGFERSYTIDQSGSPASSRSVDDDFTTLNLGAGYTADDWLWTGRAESRFGEDEDKWNLLTGVIIEPAEGLGVSAGWQLKLTDADEGTDETSSDLRLSLAWRPKNTRWIVLNRLDYKFDRTQASSREDDSHRIINNLNLNYKPDHRLQVAMQYGAKYVLDTIDDATYTGYTDLIGLETRYDINERWDVGLRTSVLHSWNAGQVDYSAGAFVGCSFVKNVWVSVGYNFIGFEDKDFSAAGYTAQGPFMQFRFKFDQQSVREMVDWFGGQQAE